MRLWSLYRGRLRAGWSDLTGSFFRYAHISAVQIDLPVIL